MLCRRCGMKSSTTDVCEWCKRPMLSAGGTASASEEPKEEMAEGMAALGGEAGQAEGPTADAGGGPESGNGSEVHELRPLGGGLGGSNPEMPSHGLGANATETSVDVSQYSQGEDSIFRPVAQPERDGQAGGPDRARETRKKQDSKSEPEIPENVRLMRSVAAALIISPAFALIQFVLSKTSESIHGLPPELTFATARLMRSVGEPNGLLWALVYGVLVGLMMGVGLGALLVRFRRGPFAGMIVGIVIGLGMVNMPWGLICGGVTGIVVGRIATVGIRQVLNV